MGIKSSELMKLLPVEKHWELFPEFCKLEIEAGGPDPQVKIISSMAKQHGTTNEEVLWWVACYSVLHCVPSAEALALLWPYRRVLDTPVEEMTRWLVANWPGMQMRPERKCVRVPANMARCIKDFASFCHSYNSFGFCRNWNNRFNEETYNSAWSALVGNVKFIGRYMAIKFLEIARAAGVLEAHMPDMRPAGAWSPRLVLGSLWPEHYAAMASNSDDVQTLALANRLSEETISVLQARHGVEVGHFALQVLLCEYREVVAGGFYPGCSHDEEEVYYDKVNAHFGGIWRGSNKSSMYDWREFLFNRSFLGELNGWHGIRRELWHTFRKHGYIWSDNYFDYTKTTNFKEPVRRA